MTGGRHANTDMDGRHAEAPAWLEDESELRGILHRFLDKLDQRPMRDRTKPPAITLNAKIAPRLFSNNESSQRSWALLQSLDGKLVTIRHDRRRNPFDPDFTNARLTFIAQAEDVCRVWLNRAPKERYGQAWEEAIDAHAPVFADRGEALRKRPFKLSGKTAHEIVAAFARIGACAAPALSLRQLSARTFWGNSKVLDPRLDLLRASFPDLVVHPRPVLVDVYLPKDYEGVLFIENQDTYLQALGGQPESLQRLALVYSAGFRSSAERVRRREGVRLHYWSASSLEQGAEFESWWYGAEQGLRPSWFWGDLDFAGMQILKSLRHRFPGMGAWEPAYARMLALLNEKGGHTPELADKSEQKDPGATGCPYADTILLPALRAGLRFVDQEIL